jgi:flagellar biosynthetic protein FliP
VIGRSAGLAVAAFILAALASPASAQSLTVDFSSGGGLTTRAVQLYIAIALLAMAPGLVIMMTCFPFMITVLSILRQAIGVQQAPPNMMIISLALILTWFVMEPVAREAWDAGVRPMNEGLITPEEAVPRALAPFRAFMERRTDPGTIALLDAARPAAGETDAGTDAQAEALPEFSLLVPAFVLTEIRRGFEAGFLIFLPFLVIDLVVAAILMSMGMMMIPPAAVSLPFKLIFFVMADGWALLAGTLVRGYQ